MGTVKKMSRAVCFIAALIVAASVLMPYSAAQSVNETKRYLGEAVNAGHDTGYSQNQKIKDDDPHFGWKLGSFYVDGYTRVTENKSGDPVFLKTVGDTVTLWFELNQDINKLNGNDKLIINDDKNGYDEYFGIEKTDFGRGVLIIRHTDYRNSASSPVQYIDYLAATASKDAAVEVRLCEEGDYEVALNYEIRKNNMNIFGWNPLPTYNDYRIFFRFSVRNGNCMVYPFDVVTGAELTNSSITENGFYLDLAKSRYLNIDIKKEIRRAGAEGLTEDTRFNKPAKDGKAYTDEGIYTITVSNLYTNQTTTKIIYVGTDSVLKAHVVTGLSIGDIESQPFLEAIRQFQHEKGHDNVILIHVTLIPYLKASQEMKTKPTQASVKELQGMGIQPDILVCRSEYPLGTGIKDKLALFCNVPANHVLQNLDVEYLYEAPLAMEREKLADVVLSSLRLENRKPDLSDWEEMVESLRNPNKTVKIAIVGKYTQLHDAYLSVVEALKHGGISCRAKVELDWIDSEELTEKNLDQQLHNVDGILVPGGFGNRGTEGMILAAQYARVHKIPYLGICLGMQMAIVEFARHVLGYEDANSIELNPETKHPVIALMPDQEDIEDIGGTLRLGSYPCILAEGSRSYELFGKKEIHERHRHRYEVNNAFRKELQEKGMNIVGTSPDNHIVEMIEIAGHPFYVGTQAHPEFKSRPNHAHPLFRGFIQAAVDKKISEEQQQK